MDGGTWFISIILFILFAVLFVQSFVPFYARYTVLRHAQRIELPLPDRLERVASRRLMLGLRGGALGALVSTAVVVAAFQWVIGDAHGATLTGLFIVGAAFVGGGAGTAIASFSGSISVTPDRPRVARSGAVAVRDYVAPLELVGARVVVVAAVLLLAGVTAFPAKNSAADYFGIALFAVFGVIALVMFEVVSRRIVDQSQPAGSTAELVWDDAIRASTLRTLVTAPLALGTYCLIFGLVGYADANSDVIVGFIGAFFSAGLLAAAIVSRVTRTQSYFLRRLWPNLRWSDTADAATEVA